MAPLERSPARAGARGPRLLSALIPAFLRGRHIKWQPSPPSRRASRTFQRLLLRLCRSLCLLDHPLGLVGTVLLTSDALVPLRLHLLRHLRASRAMAAGPCAPHLHALGLALLSRQDLLDLRL